MLTEMAAGHGNCPWTGVSHPIDFSQPGPRPGRLEGMNAGRTFSRCLLRETRGSAVVEYALVVLLVVVAAAPALATVGKRVTTAFYASIAAFNP